MDDSTGCKVELDDIDEQELKRRYYERLSGWSEPGVVKINQNGKLLEPPGVLRTWKPKIPLARPKC
jgi:hypothetical protein